MIGIVLGAPGASRAKPVTVEWEAVTTNADSSSISDLAGYRLYYSTRSFDRDGWLTPAQARVAADVTSVSAGKDHAALTLDLDSAATYHFRLTALDSTGNESAFNLSASGVDEELTVTVTDETVVSFGNDAKRPPGRISLVNTRHGGAPTMRFEAAAAEELIVTFHSAAGRTVFSEKPRQIGASNGRFLYECQLSQACTQGLYFATIQGKTDDGGTFDTFPLMITRK